MMVDNSRHTSHTSLNPAIRVLCVDDLSDVTAVTRMLVDLEPDMKCVGCLHSAENLIDVARDLKANVIVLDANMPGKPPFEAMRELATEMPYIKTIIYSGYDDQSFNDTAMEAGAWGCISKNDPPDVVVKAVRAVASGQTHFTALKEV